MRLVNVVILSGLAVEDKRPPPGEYLQLPMIISYAGYYPVPLINSEN